MPATFTDTAGLASKAASGCYAYRQVKEAPNKLIPIPFTIRQAPPQGGSWTHDRRQRLTVRLPLVRPCSWSLPKCLIRDSLIE
jgi:hypothetical protein